MDKLHKKKVAQVLKNIPYKLLDKCVYFCYYNYNVKVILDGYPFKPPVVFLNNKCISYYESPYRLVKKYEHVHKLCLCCSSISNMQNWNINPEFSDQIEIKAFDSEKQLEKKEDSYWYSGYYGHKSKSLRISYKTNSSKIKTILKILNN